MDIKINVHKIKRYVAAILAVVLIFTTLPSERLATQASNDVNNGGTGTLSSGNSGTSGGNSSSQVVMHVANSVYTMSYGNAVDNEVYGEFDGQRIPVDSYESGNLEVAIIENGTIKVVGTGTTTITATINDSGTYQGNSATYELTVEKGLQDPLVWSITEIPDNLTDEDTFTNVASNEKKEGTGEIVYSIISSTPEGIATVSGNGQVSFVKDGTVTVEARRPGGVYYEDVTNTYTITVGTSKSDQLPIEFAVKETVSMVYGGAYTNSVIGGSVTDGTIIYESSNPSIATVDADGKVTAVGVCAEGETVTISAVMKGNDSYKDSNVATYTIVVKKAEQDTPLAFSKGKGRKEVGYGNSTYQNIATGGNTGVIVYTSSNPEVATVDAQSGLITTKALGSTMITATSVGGDYYDDKSISYTLVVKKGNPGLAFENGTETKTLPMGTVYQNKATAKDGSIEINYTSSNTDIVDVDDSGNLVFKNVGNATIQAEAVANDLYEADTITYNVIIERGNLQELSWDKELPESITCADSYQRQVLVDGTVIYESLTPEVATVDRENGKVTFIKAGTVIIKATRVADEKYAEISVAYTLIVSKAPQAALSFAEQNPGNLEYKKTYTNEASGGSGDGIITYSSSNTSIATVNENGVVTAIGVCGEGETVTITAVKAGNDYYEDSETVSYEIVVVKAQQAEFKFENGKGVKYVTYGNTYQNKAVGGSTQNIVYVSSDEGIATVDQNGLVTVNKPGRTTITATSVGGDYFEDKTIKYTLEVEKATPILSFEKGTETQTIKYGNAYQNKATANDDSIQISYFSPDIGFVSVDSEGNLTININKDDQVTITATTVENEYYESTSLSYPVKVEKANVTWNAILPESITWEENLVYPRQVVGTGDITYKIQSMVPDDIATIDTANGDVSISKPGTIVVKVTVQGTMPWDKVTDTYTLNVVKAQQASLSFADKNLKELKYGETYTNAVTGGSGDGTITYTSSNPSVVTVDENGMVKAVGICAEGETVTITAVKAGNDCYEDSEAVSYEVVVVKAQQADFTFSKGKGLKTVTYGNEYQNKATGGSTQNIVYASSNEEIATVDQDGIVTIKKPGRTTITATSVGGDYYEDKSINYTLEVNEADPGLSFNEGTETKTIPYGTLYQNQAMSKAEGLTIIYTSSNEDVAIVDNNGNLTIRSVGTATIKAEILASECYLGSSVTYDVVVVKGEQQPLSWDKELPESIIWTETYQRSALGGSTNGAITYESLTPEIATVDSFGKVTFSKSGTVEIKATKAGDDNYNDVSATYTLEVSTLSQERVYYLNESPDSLKFGETYTNTVSGGSSGGEIVYESSNPSIATVDKSGTVTPVRVCTEGESVTISAYIKGNEHYSDSERATYEIVIIPGTIPGTFAFEQAVSDTVLYGTKDYQNQASFESDIISSSECTITYASDNSAVATVDSEDGLIETRMPGYATITATLNAGSNYEEWTISYTLHVAAGIQEVVIQNTETTINCDDTFTLRATAKSTTDEPASIKYSVSQGDGTVATINDNGELTIITSGTVELVASVEATTYYTADTAIYELIIVKAEPELEFEEKTINTTFNDNGNWYQNVPTCKSTLKNPQYVYSIVSDENQIIEIINNDGTIKVCGSGTAEIKATFEGNEWFVADEVTYTINVAMDEQEITFPQNAYTITNGEWFGSDPKATEVGDLYGIGDISYYMNEGDDPAGIIASLDEGTGAVTFTGRIGTATIRAQKDADDNYEMATTSYQVTVVSAQFAEGTYELVGDKKNDSDWFTGNVSIYAKEGYQVSYSALTSEAEWMGALTDAVVADGENHTVVFYVQKKDTGAISAPIEVYVDKDTVSPVITGMTLEADIELTKTDIEYTATEQTINLFANDPLKLLGTNGGSVTKRKFVIEANDSMSQLELIQYYVDTAPEKGTKKAEDLDSVNWTKYDQNNPPTIQVNKQCIIYVKATDKAGNYQYASSNGIIYEDKKPTIEYDITGKKSGETYLSDVTIDLDVADLGVYTGIKEVTYEVSFTQEGTKEVTQSGTYVIGDGSVLYGNLVQSWSTKYDDEYLPITVNSVENDYDEVQVLITATDNVGNTETVTINLAFDITPPTLEVTYLNDPPKMNSISDQSTLETVDYYQENRTAQIVITGKKRAFNPDNVIITATAVNALGEPVVGEDGKLVTENIVAGKWIYNKNNGQDPNDDTYTTTIEFANDAKYQFSVSYTDKWGVPATTGFSSETFVIDSTKPTGSITIDGITWTSTDYPSVITFENNNTVPVTVSAAYNDITSPLKEVKVFKTKSTSWIDVANSQNIAWEDYTGDFPAGVDSDEHFTIYMKVMDYADNTTYYNSNGFVVDGTASEIVEVIPEANAVGYYNADIPVEITVMEKEASSDVSYSGIKNVKYTVEYFEGESKTVTQSGTLYSFKPKSSDDYKYENLKEEFKTEPGNEKKSIVIDAEVNNSDKVVLTVTTVDNAGNPYSETYEFKIDVTAPEMTLKYDDNVCNEMDGRGYFDNDRAATIIIKERTTAFDEDAALKLILDNITAYDAENKSLEESIREADWGELEWSTKEGNKPDDATHTLVIPFKTDANYTINSNAILYTDMAGNPCKEITIAKGTKAPYAFTIDKLDPAAEVTLDGMTWNTLLDTLTFRCSKQDKVEVEITAQSDATSPYDIYYYETDVTTQMNSEELETVVKEDSKGWTKYENRPIEITDNKHFTYYFKVVDYAGNTIYLNTDGYILDRQLREDNITIELEETDIKHNGINVYNDDVDVTISVEDPDDYSGIKTVEYWVTCTDVVNGELKTTETQRATLYDFIGDDEELDKTKYPTYNMLKNTFTDSIIIEAAKNNSCDVMLYVKVTDRANNEVTKTQKLDIDITAPTIQIGYDNNDLKGELDGREYYGQSRIATITITERAGHYEAAKASDGIKITATNAAGASDTGFVFKASELGWKTTKSNNGCNNDTHAATISYNVNANYTFSISYTDYAGNANVKDEAVKGTATDYKFTVDSNVPTGSISVTEMGTWETLIKTLTFGLRTQHTVRVSGKATDVTSPIKEVSYYRTGQTTALTEGDLKGVGNWTPFTEFSIAPNEKFVIYKKIVDYADNVTYISTNGVVLDNASPQISISVPETINGLYNDDVTIGVSVSEPAVGATGAYSGINEITYAVYSMGVQTQTGSLYSYGIADPTYSQLTKDISASVVVDKYLNNSNDVTITINAVDNAGNQATESQVIKIDVSKPVIEVSYDNNEGDTSFGDKVYFKENRTAIINIKERNFNPNKVEVVVQNEHGVVPTISAWTSKAGSGNGDDTTHTATLLFSEDGDYTFDISCKDDVENANEDVNYMESLAPQAFTVDKTLPVVSLEYDNNEGQNDNYYKAERVATVRIREHNFETSRIKVTIEASDNGEEKEAPSISNWSSNGDVHTATVRYENDSLYTFDIEYTDMAGNIMEDFAKDIFYVDKTSPEVFILDVQDESANNNSGNIGFSIRATDTNFDVFEPVLEATVKDGDKIVTKQVEVGNITDIENGMLYTVTNLDADGIYKIKCTVVDKAGNAYEQVVLTDKSGKNYTEERFGDSTLLTFSVNRGGSTYGIDDNTAKMIENYYLQNVTNDVVIYEINTNELTSYKVTLNGVDLTEGTDYTVAVEGTGSEWRKYTYTIKKSLFEAEGEYQIVVSSTDKAENNAFSDVKDASVGFVVDRTAPIVTVTGLATNGRYQIERQTVTIVPADDGGALKSISVYMVDDDGNTVEELMNLSGTDLEAALEADGGKLTFDIDEGLYQNVRIVCDDYSVGEEEATNVYDETFANVSVSTSAVMIFWANKALRYGTIGGGVGIISLFIILLIWKKRKKEQNN